SCQRSAPMTLIVGVLVLTLAPQSAAPAASQAAAPDPAPAAAPGIVAQMQAEAAAMKPLATSALAGEFLAAISCLPPLAAPRVVFYDKARGLALTDTQASAMTPEQLTGYERRECNEAFYYSTRYGTPVAFVRPLEILGQAGVQSVDGLKVLDF